jgi:hypothetical protein
LTGIKSKYKKQRFSGVGHQSCAQRGEQLSVAQKAAKSPQNGEMERESNTAASQCKRFLKIFFAGVGRASRSHASGNLGASHFLTLIGAAESFEKPLKRRKDGATDGHSL